MTTRKSSIWSGTGLARGAALAALSVAVFGCALNPKQGFLDPTKVGMFPSEYKEGGVRRVLTPREGPIGLANATEPIADDLKPVFEQYRIGPQDLIQLVIEDFIQPGVPYSANLEVNPAGMLRLPQLGEIRAQGMTEAEFERDLVARIQQAEIAPRPLIQVTIGVKRQNTFSILGGIRNEGTYNIPYPELRLLEALGLGAGLSPGVRRIYVIRRGQDVYKTPSVVTPTSAMLDSDGEYRLAAGFVTGEAEPIQDSRPAPPADLRDAMAPRPGGAAANSTAPSSPTPAFKPLVLDPATGQSREAPTARGSMPALEPLNQPAQSAPSDRSFEWEDLPAAGELSQRVIEVDVFALKSGDPKFNIVVRPRDVIVVPIDTGLFYVMGEVNRPGVFGFNEREITLKQAVAIFGGFTPLAWPSRCEIIRRERGTDKQVTVPVNLDSIFAGLEDDILLRDDDIINVGSNFVAPFLFVIRNSFRFTYGFGFVYDRNFADRDSYGGRLNPETRADQRQQSRGLPF